MIRRRGSFWLGVLVGLLLFFGVSVMMTWFSSYGYAQTQANLVKPYVPQGATLSVSMQTTLAAKGGETLLLVKVNQTKGFPSSLWLRRDVGLMMASLVHQSAMGYDAIEILWSLRGQPTYGILTPTWSLLAQARGYISLSAWAKTVYVFR